MREGGGGGEACGEGAKPQRLVGKTKILLGKA